MTQTTEEASAPARTKRSVMGAFALALGVLSVVMLLAGGLMGFGLAFRNRGGPIPNEAPVAVVAALLFVALVVTSLSGLALSVAGIKQTRKKRGSAIAGLCLNALLAVCGIALLIFGFLVQSGVL